ncbi:MAG: glycosyl hydrolase [Alistipes sp.]
MRKIVVIALLALGGVCFAQPNAQLPAGYPDRSANQDPRVGFVTPPKGYGEVPFYWWMGDTLTREHLAWHLEILSQKKISSLQVNYAHTDKGGITYGVTIPSKPKLFSPAWWELFGWFMAEAKKRDMTVSLSDYTLGVGQGSYVDEMLAEDASMNGFELRFLSDTLVGHSLKRTYKTTPLSVLAYELNAAGVLTGTPVDLTARVKKGLLVWRSAWSRTLVTAVCAERKLPSLDPMHPQAGASYVRHFFQRFEDRFPAEAKGGLNFFFSDELSFNLNGNIWNDIFRAEFQKRKGYDLVPYLDALFMDRGDITPKIRLDYNDVRVALSEEHFFIPLYAWHQQRQLLFGCDHGGRGMDVTEFGDYFRTQRWNQAPGCDQPMLQKNIIKNKVASSISHLYERQRVWLEGFHSSKWSTNTEQLTDAIFANFAMGQNLLSLHGLYYSTAGGWWEWAAPCNHFHEPYWKEMEGLLTCTERLSYLLSQGYHCADVALLYPVEPVVAGYGDAAVQTAFAAGEYLYKQGIDFDFMDYESLARAEVQAGHLAVAGERFRILIVPSMRAIRQASLEKMLAFKQQGGIILNLGDLPEASETAGRNDPKLKQLVASIFATNGDGSVVCLQRPDELLPVIDSLTTRDFRVLAGSAAEPYVMHRRIGQKELYAVYNVAKGATCFFRAKGGVELWNPWTGETETLAVERVTEAGTVVRMPLNSTDMHLLFFNAASEPTIACGEEREVSQKIRLDSLWRFELTPLLDNRFGDFHWPATQELLGAYVYKAKERGAEESFSFGTKFLLLEAVPALTEAQLLSHLPEVSDGVSVDGRKYVWQPYKFSWRWGVEGDYGHQGWHGLKTEMYDDFIRLGKIRRTDHALERVADDNGNKNYYLYTRVQAPRKGVYAVEYGPMKPATLYLNGQQVAPAAQLSLEKGVNEILLHYDSHGTTRFALRDGAPDVLSQTLCEAPLRTKFRGDRSLLLFDVRKQADTRSEFRFCTAPGVEKLEFAAYGAATVSIGDTKAVMSVQATREDGLKTYTATLPQRVVESAEAVIEVTEPWGYAGGSVIDGPVKQVCGEGLIPIGDWSQIDGLTAYSGGAWYRTTCILDGQQAQTRVELDLGKVISTAEVWVNGRKVGCRLSAPWRMDITEQVVVGENKIEVFVCNTAANHYLSTPTAYRGEITSGILGPVTIECLSKK